MSRPRQARRSNATWSLALSLVAHVGLLGSAGVVAYRSLSEKEARSATVRQAEPGLIAIDLPGVAEGTLLEDHETVPIGQKPEAFGGAAVARIDTGSPGAGGDVTGARATNLAAVDDQMRADPDLLSRLDRDQVQRLKTAPYRTTHEDRRATTHPMELTFLVTGKGSRIERRPDAADPSRGSLEASAASVVGGRPGERGDAEPGDGQRAGAANDGNLMGSPGAGVRDGKVGLDHHRGAAIGYARPAVTEGAPTVPGIWNGKPRDTVDSDQEVANAVRSLIQASHAGGIAGDGRGGSGAGGDPGAGGSSTHASVARPLGSGDGDLVDWNTTDPLLVPYFRKIHAKVDPLWANAFPKSAMLELKQGTVILEFEIAQSGQVKVTWPPARPSGIDEFDKNCADAIRRAGPFEPLPPSLQRTRLRIRAPFVAKNPIVK